MKQNIDYKVHCFRLAEDTVIELAKLKGVLSWNAFFVSIIRKSKGICCEKCGSSGYLEIHHIIALKDGGSDLPENKQYLCLPCHKKTDNYAGKKTTIQKTLL